MEAAHTHHQQNIDLPKGKLVIFAAPSGSGKTTLVKYLLTQINGLLFSVSATTRKRRPTEMDGVDYYFLTVDSFKKRIAAGQFLEWQEVYEGCFYGTLKSEIDRIRDLGKHIIFDMDVKGALNIKNYYGNDALAIFVRPPSIEELHQRLTNRNTENAETIQKRIDKAAEEISYESQFDVTLVNDQLDIALKDAFNLVTQFLNTGKLPEQRIIHTTQTDSTLA